MNYQKIHDAIISRASTRKQSEDIIYESHHITPKCEGGSENGPTVYLTVKEHILVHRLRYKITNILGNLKAYHLMKFGRPALYANFTEICVLGGKEHHRQYKEKDPLGYYKRQSTSGKLGGLRSLEHAKGFFSLTKEQKKEARDRGRDTTVSGKLGMFSEEYREQHRLTLYKSIITPDGRFDSMSNAANHFGVCNATITHRVNSTNSRWNEWYYDGDIK